MDELILKLGGDQLAVSQEPNTTIAPHPRYSQFKQKSEGFGDQAHRRRQLLKLQQEKRQKTFFQARGIVEGEIFEDDDDMDGGDEDEIDAGKTPPVAAIAAGTLPTKKKSKRKKVTNPYKNQLMLSEWMVDVPEDLATEWLMVICPVGKRSMVVAARGTSVAYSRSGYCLNCFPSYLPGGNRRVDNCLGDSTIVDCIFNESTQTYYVLDIMCWRSHPVCDSEAQFRRYWLQTKLAEEGHRAQEVCRVNPLKFLPLQHFACDKDTLQKLFAEPWPQFKVDGLLFFHKKSLYMNRRSPLVLWLKVNMVPDILGVPVSQNFLQSSDLSGPTSSNTTQMES